MSEADRKGIVVVGSINKDFVVRAERLPQPGESIVGHEFFQGFGGKGANQAVGIARLEVGRVQFVGGVGGDDIGRSGLESLRGEGIDCRFVRTVDETNTGVALIMLNDQGENCIAAAPGANAYVDESYVESLPDDLFREASLLVVCQEIPVEAIAVILRKAKSFDVKTLFNPAPPNDRLNSANLLQYVDYLTPNETEVKAITGVDIEFDEAAVKMVESRDAKVRAVQALLDRGANHIAITTGADGCFVFDQSTMQTANDSVQIAAPKVSATDTTAAGDCFNAALATAIYHGRPFLDACRWANQVAAISVTRNGAQASLPKRNECPPMLN